MKKSFQIFKRDLGRLFRNRAAVLILVGISVLPVSLCMVQHRCQYGSVWKYQGNPGCDCQ